ncbi:MAG: SIMPL domain-containing protein [Gemmatimonadetes bacterium]|nr:SIMPL domain-containing protein [Gemmatimonadota bacterium]
MMVRFYTIVAALSVAAGGIVEAQGTGGGVAVPQSPQAPVPEVSVTARGEVTMAPDKARVQLGVETRAKTAAVAAQENARRQGGVLTAIRAFGVPASQITTVGYSVSPVQRYDEKLNTTVVDGYEVHNIVAVETERVEQVGGIIDAALGAGANRVVGIDFLLRDPGAAEDRALERAVQQARRQAEVAARAAGGSVSGLLELRVNPEARPEGNFMVAMARMAPADGAPTPVSAGTLTVSVTVATRWQFARP